MLVPLRTRLLCFKAFCQVLVCLIPCLCGVYHDRFHSVSHCQADNRAYGQTHGLSPMQITSSNAQNIALLALQHRQTDDQLDKFQYGFSFNTQKPHMCIAGSSSLIMLCSVCCQHAEWECMLCCCVIKRCLEVLLPPTGPKLKINAIYFRGQLKLQDCKSVFSKGFVCWVVF